MVVDYVVRQLVAIRLLPREVLRQQVTRTSDRLDECVGKLLALEMATHRLHESFPKFGPTFLMHSLIAHDRKLLRARRDEDENAIALAGPRHTELLELLAPRAYRVGHFAALNENADLARSRRFRRGDRPNDAVVLQLSDKFFRAHTPTNWTRRRRRPTSRRHR